MASRGRRGERGDRLARRGGALARPGGLTAPLTAVEAAAVARAREYPWRAAEPTPASAEAVDAALRDGATGVLAYGSNASPEVLWRKLGATAAAVLARPVVLTDADVVYSAHVSAHGAIPGTLAHAAGTEIDAWLLALPAGAIAALDATEPNYRRALRAGLPAQAYLSRHGPLRIDGEAVALAAVPARGRTLSALTEAQLLEQVRLRMAPDEAPDRFVLAQLADERVRATRSAALRAGL
jgi:hypothetical protein